ncbi:alpha/beta hydrolase-fold protein [uncultured Chitinophaga sp.]|uniref:carboxylesterase family protein n=1 Tax=uncultured Chitinophaga sp. TaxID=339340 RepID=UPI0025CB8533|nr:alpha/beta hydrolase-fold protein [uncultured Chitinophaga sp.]
MYSKLTRMPLVVAALTMFLGVMCMLSCGKNNVDPDKNPTDTITNPGGGGGGTKPVTFVPQTSGLLVKKMTNRDTGGISSQYVLYIPQGYNDNKEKLWPTIIYLHGLGERGNDIELVRNTGLAKRVNGTTDLNFIVIAPQCNKGTWWDLPSVARLYDEVIKIYNIDQSRMYLTGNSMGGFASWTWAIMRQDRFAAIAPISAPKPDNWADVCKTSSRPIWTFHNANDEQVRVADARFMDTAIMKCNATKFKYTENPTGGHDAWTKVYNDPAFYEWMLQYKK